MSSKCLNCLNSEHPSIIRAWRQHCFINNTHPFMPVCECHIVGIVFCMRYTLHCRYQYTARKVFRTKGMHMQGAILPAGCCTTALCVSQKVPMAEHVARRHHLSAQHFIRNVLQRPYVGGENWTQKGKCQPRIQKKQKKKHRIRKRSPTKPWNVTVISVFCNKQNLSCMDTQVSDLKCIYSLVVNRAFFFFFTSVSQSEEDLQWLEGRKHKQPQSPSQALIPKLATLSCVATSGILRMAFCSVF